MFVEFSCRRFFPKNYLVMEILNSWSNCGECGCFYLSIVPATSACFVWDPTVYGRMVEGVRGVRSWFPMCCPTLFSGHLRVTVVWLTSKDQLQFQLSSYSSTHLGWVRCKMKMRKSRPQGFHAQQKWFVEDNLIQWIDCSERIYRKQRDFCQVWLPGLIMLAS